MDSGKKSFFEKGSSPVYQALLTFGGVVAVNIGGWLVRAAGIMDITQRFPWMTAAAFMLCFALFNSVLSLSAQNRLRYWSLSIYSFMGLAAASGLLAWLISGLAIGEAGSYRWIFIVVTFGYLVFTGMMSFIRNIVELAEREEWNHPRLRQRSRKR